MVSEPPTLRSNVGGKKMWGILFYQMNMCQEVHTHTRSSSPPHLQLFSFLWETRHFVVCRLLEHLSGYSVAARALLISDHVPLCVHTLKFFIDLWNSVFCALTHLVIVINEIN